VSFDYEAALQAAAQLKVTADSLLGIAAELEVAVPIAAEDWEGPFRDVFDVDSADFYAALRSMAGTLMSLRTEIRTKALQYYAEHDGPLQAGLDEEWDESDLARFEAELDADLEDYEAEIGGTVSVLDTPGVPGSDYSILTGDD
jgi:uncharacterized protein YukE